MPGCAWICSRNPFLLCPSASPAQTPVLVSAQGESSSAQLLVLPSSFWKRKIKSEKKKGLDGQAITSKGEKVLHHRASPELFPISKLSTHLTAGSVPALVLEAGEEELGPPLHSTLADQILGLPSVIVPVLGHPGCLTGLCAGVGGGGEECWWWDLAAPPAPGTEQPELTQS